MLEQTKAIVREFLHRVLSLGDIAATGDYFHDDMVEEVPLPGQGPGLAGLKETLRALRVAFPDMRWDVEEQMAEDNRVLTRFVWRGTHQGSFLGIPPTQKSVRVRAWSSTASRARRSNPLESSWTHWASCSNSARCRAVRRSLARVRLDWSTAPAARGQDQTFAGVARFTLGSHHSAPPRERPPLRFLSRAEHQRAERGPSFLAVWKDAGAGATHDSTVGRRRGTDREVRPCC